MAYSNGRIYVDTSVTPNVGVSIADLQQCFAVVIEATIDGQTVRRLSADLGVHCALKTGDTFTSNGVTWRVVSRREINLWARYKPIPCRVGGTNNVPRALTTAQRVAENFGVETNYDQYISAEWVQGFENYADTLDLTQPYTGIKKREFNRPFGNQYIRLTDFVKTADNGAAVANIGYDHNAQPDNIILHKGSTKSYQLAPLVASGNRTIYIPSGSLKARYEFPYDALWLPLYFYTDAQKMANNITIDRNEEWLSPVDFVSGDTYSTVVRANTVRRGVAIFLWGSRTGKATGWRCIAIVIDRTASVDSNDSFHRSFADHPEAYIDLTDTSNTTTAFLETGQSLRTLNGEYLFMEFWSSQYGSGSRDSMPIPGYAYVVDIKRNQLAPDDIDVEGIVEFLGVAANGDYIDLSFRVDETVWGSYSQNVWNLLKAKYTVLSTSTNVNNVSRNATYNILTQYNNEAFDLISRTGGFAYYSVSIGLINDDYDPDSEPDWTATITVRQIGESNNHSKVFVIDRSSLDE